MSTVTEYFLELSASETPVAEEPPFGAPPGTSGFLPTPPEMSSWLDPFLPVQPDTTQLEEPLQTDSVLPVEPERVFQTVRPSATPLQTLQPSAVPSQTLQPSATRSRQPQDGTIPIVIGTVAMLIIVVIALFRKRLAKVRVRRAPDFDVLV